MSLRYGLMWRVDLLIQFFERLKINFVGKFSEEICYHFLLALCFVINDLSKPVIAFYLVISQATPIFLL